MNKPGNEPTATPAENQLNPTQTLDVKGLNCPLPILKTKLALRRLQAEDLLQVLATDPHSVVDFKAYCAETGHELIHSVEHGPVFEFFIRVGAKPNF